MTELNFLCLLEECTGRTGVRTACSTRVNPFHMYPLFGVI